MKSRGPGRLRRPVRRPAAPGLATSDGGDQRISALSEDAAWSLGPLFRCLAALPSRDKMLAGADSIEAMEREKAGYRLGMAMHRRNPSRVLMALRCLLTDPTSRR